NGAGGSACAGALAPTTPARSVRRRGARWVWVGLMGKAHSRKGGIAEGSGAVDVPVGDVFTGLLPGFLFGTGIAALSFGAGTAGSALGASLGSGAGLA